MYEQDAARRRSRAAERRIRACGARRGAGRCAAGSSFVTSTQGMSVSSFSSVERPCCGSAAIPSGATRRGSAFERFSGPVPIGNEISVTPDERDRPVIALAPEHRSRGNPRRLPHPPSPRAGGTRPLRRDASRPPGASRPTRTRLPSRNTSQVWISRGEGGPTALAGAAVEPGVMHGAAESGSRRRCRPASGEAPVAARGGHRPHVVPTRARAAPARPAAWPIKMPPSGCPRTARLW
jgi:hypothetical protein